MRCKSFVLVTCFFLCGLTTNIGFAADYPTQPIEAITPYAPGGSSDGLNRIWGEIASKQLGQPVIAICRPGAGGSVAAAEVISSKPDGYKIVQLGNIFFATTTKTQKIPFNPNDLVPVVNLMEYRFAFSVRSDSPFKTFNELLDYGRTHPGELKWSSTPRGTSIHLMGLMIFKKAGVKVIEVPYKGGGPEQVIAMLGGHVDFSVSNYGPFSEHARAGKIRFLAVLSEHRWRDLPDVPTIAELGYPEVLRLSTYVGYYVHKNTPDHIRKKLFDVSKKVFDDPKFTKTIEEMGEQPRFGGPEWMKEAIRQAEEAGVPMLKELGLYVKQ